MVSRAAAKFERDLLRSSQLRGTLTRLRRAKQSLDRDEVQSVLSASLTASVSSWQSYIVGLISDFHDELMNPGDPHFTTMHGISRALSTAAVEKFNTPNWENSRTLISVCTSYDPIAVWQWTAKGLNVQAVQQRLNQILKVRHSFAHGFAVPAYAWTQDSRGRVRLTVEAIQFSENLFRHLVLSTDAGIKASVLVPLGRGSGW